MRTQAERDVRGAMLLEKIGEIEKVDISDEEIEAEIGQMAEYYRTDPTEVRKNFEENKGLEQVRNNLKTQKAIEALISKAKITEGDWVDETAGEPNVEQENAKKPKKTAKPKAKAEPRSEKPKAAKKKTAK